MDGFYDWKNLEKLSTSRKLNPSLNMNVVKVDIPYVFNNIICITIVYLFSVQSIFQLELLAIVLGFESRELSI